MAEDELKVPIEFIVLPVPSPSAMVQYETMLEADLIYYQEEQHIRYQLIDMCKKQDTVYSYHQVEKYIEQLRTINDEIGRLERTLAAIRIHHPL
ncbi:hypothetical protein TRVA0_052S01266 [Trichomonascus vanleenenianus]|uniref:uncharacterized protein n=1 Tax=Trichomonascus vanleenenianus TaxID=2268995 RepID=UPI003EC98969